MSSRHALSDAAFLKSPGKFHQGKIDRIADSLELKQIYTSFALFILADTRLSHSDDRRKLRLGQFRLYSNAAKQPEEYLSIMLPFSRKSSNPLHTGSIGII
jgi:hypothetical protein